MPPPLRQPCPQGGGGVNDASVLPVLGAFLDVGNTALITTGRCQAGGAAAPKSVLYASYQGFLQSIFFNNTQLTKKNLKNNVDPSKLNGSREWKFMGYY